MSVELVNATHDKESLTRQIQENRETIMRFQNDRKKELVDLMKQLKERDLIIDALKLQLKTKEVLVSSANAGMKNVESLKTKITELTNDKAQLANTVEDLKVNEGKF